MNHRGKSLGATEIAGLLRREITRGELASKDRLPAERVMADTYGVARGTIREALNQLGSEGLVEIRPGSGTYVIYNPDERANAVIANTRPLELIDSRFALEPHICRLAVLHATQDDFKKAEELLSEMEQNNSSAIEFSAADTKFHALLAETTKNSLLIRFISQINSVRNQEQWAHMRNITLNETTIAQYNKQHRQILNAIRTREPERAANLMKEHLETARLSLTRAAAT